MLGERAVYYYKQGYSCSCCIMKAAEEKYGISASELYKALGGINNGLGIGSVCSVPITCIMILGMLYCDENILKQKRLEFLISFHSEFSSLNCSEIQKHISLCDEVILKGCNILEKVIK